MTIHPLRAEPVWLTNAPTSVSADVSREAAMEAVRTLLAYIGEDPDREGLLDTPDRVVRAYAEQFAGYQQDPASILATTFAEVEGYQDLVVLRDIPFHSTCEHHLQPFDGIAHVAYLPGERVVGLSKLARLVDCFARRAQIQERLTRQITRSLMEHLQPRGAAAYVEAAHGCMRCRGVRKEGARMITTAYEGDLTSASWKDEFLRLVGR
ncbi:MAG: GTP cyclohydrolase I FolE [Candidatus Sericytochromatia bacterium]|nr:GTP cyclohydrolase I FolE [Candidatus Sericytochromatia bacterium]